MKANTNILLDARAEALFASNVQPSDRLDPAQIQAAIAASIRAHGSRGCAALVAQEYGDHPDTAVNRMTWARTTVTRLAAPPSLQTGNDFRPAPPPQRVTTPESTPTAAHPHDQPPSTPPPHDHRTPNKEHRLVRQRLLGTRVATHQKG